MNYSLDLKSFKFDGNKLIVLLGLILLPLLILGVVNFGNKIDPLLIYEVLFLGFIISFFIFKKSIQTIFIPYLMIQMIDCFFDPNKYLGIVGLNLKLHALVFGLGTIVSAYLILTNFKYLWSNFRPFRYLFLFFVVSTVYAFFYHSDFRNSTYIDTWIFNNMDLRTQSIGSGYQGYSREFGHDETQFLIYLTGLFPIIAISISSMVFKGLKSIDEINALFIKVAKYILIGFLMLFILNGLAVIAGLSQFEFMNGRLTGDFFGAGFGSAAELSTFILLFIGFKYYLNTIPLYKDKNLINILLNIMIALFVVLDLLGIKKTAMIAMGVSLLVFLLINLKQGIKSSQTKFLKIKDNQIKSIIFAVLPLLLIFIVIILNTNFVSKTLFNISDRFSSFATFEIRETNWNYFMKYWVDSLSLFKVIFGYGLDTSKEAIFFISAMQPLKYFQQPHLHNIYMEMFYEFGALAFLFFGAFISILVNNIKHIISKDSDKSIKLLSSISIAAIIFYSIYLMSEGVSSTYNLVIFSFLGFLESAKYAIFCISNSNNGMLNEDNTKLQLMK